MWRRQVPILESCAEPFPVRYHALVPANVAIPEEEVPGPCPPGGASHNGFTTQNMLARASPESGHLHRRRALYH